MSIQVNQRDLLEAQWHRLSFATGRVATQQPLPLDFGQVLRYLGAKLYHVPLYYPQPVHYNMAPFFSSSHKKTTPC